MPLTLTLIDLLAISLALIVSSIAARRLFTTSALQPPKTLITDLDAIVALLHPQPQPPIADLLSSRAQSNTRLIRAFHIDNAFTTSDPEYHTHFRGTALQLVQFVEKDLPQVSETTSSSAQKRIPAKDNTIGLAQFWRRVTLEVILVILFQDKFEPESIVEEELAFVSMAINDVWNASKHGVVDETVVTRMHSILDKWITGPAEDDPASSTVRRRNPLNLILPAYETLWRTALQTHVNIMDSPQQKELFRAFALQPTKPSFKLACPETNLSVADIVAETLRVSPPTKRIYRSIPVPVMTRLIRFLRWLVFAIPNPLVDTVAVDVEAVHVKPSIWGEDAREWKPSRQRDITSDQRRVTMPFGVGKLKCVAEMVAPKLIGILVGRAVEALEDCVIVRGVECVGGRTDCKGWSIRACH